MRNSLHEEQSCALQKLWMAREETGQIEDGSGNSQWNTVHDPGLETQTWSRVCDCGVWWNLNVGCVYVYCNVRLLLDS